MPDHQQPICLLGCLQHRIAIFQPKRHRLFAEHMLAMRQCLQGQHSVREGRRCDYHGLYRLIV
jgi:hypothetical protein